MIDEDSKRPIIFGEVLFNRFLDAVRWRLSEE